MTLPDTVESYSKYAAAEFIQTAVFVDDRIYERQDNTTGDTKSVVAPKTRKKAIKSVEAEDPIQEAEIGESDSLPDARDIVTSFAKKQIVCSLYQPKKTAKYSPESDIFPLCKAADVVILDWDLFGDGGERASELAEGLVTQAVKDVPEQLRLILIYTQEANLFDIANRLYEKITGSIGDSLVPRPEDGGLAFHTENSRVVVLGKPGRTRTQEQEAFVVDESDLADAAISEFAKLASGLLHAASLLGLSEIRKNSRKILSKFHHDLDAGFLTHLSLSLPEEDASSHVIPLLVSEIESVLEDALARPLVPKGLLADWCNNVWIPGEHLGNIFKKDGVDYRKVAKLLCTEGFKAARAEEDATPNPDAEKKKNKNTRKAAQIFLPSADSSANQRFSHLMSSRTFYGNKDKTLKLGSVVHQKDDDTYLLCIQPVCDSVRLKSDRVFVFVQMEKGGEGDGDDASHIVILSDDSVRELVYKPKSYLCFTTTFSPDLATQEVVAKPDDQGALFFENTDGKRFYWADQLRASHAQRAVERFASDLSRVGLTEAEWLRRLAKD
ncbi:hypothetical protein RGUI_3191 [Rhodovulum sp. P5]|uniref:response regulator receiver domain n=1 Tax=Rhodovulum sp. P5 TaxID=1564506 RepID=UPI0009C33BE6|nr:response regulator receiver domain [Rhodovulum sp. P5]ARE41332.1 hypothetical protein RGUI_3191 [Rhodovulum sp. P5]